MRKAEQDSLFSFSKAYRLTSKHDFQSVFAKPCKIKRKYLLALYRPNQLPHARLGITIAKHIVKRAVDRNRLRRVIRESFRQQQESLKGLDIVVLMRSECAQLAGKVGNLALRDDIGNLWHTLANSSKLV